MTSVLPQGWKVERLVDLVSVRSGQVDPRVDPYRDMPLIAPDHDESGTGRLLEVQTAHDQGAISGKYPVDAGDVIYSKIRPYLMKAHLAEFAALCSADMYPLKPRRGADSRFVLNVLLGREFTNYAVGESMRSGIPKINREGLAGYELAVPPDAEQAAIGEALADADRLIDALECLIVKKQAIKTGVMQQLLTGRVRLRGFSGLWETKKLSEVLRFQTGFPFPSAHFTDSPTGARLVRNRDLRSDDSKVYYSGELLSEYVLARGDVLVGMDGEFEPVVWREEGSLLNQRVGRLRVTAAASSLYLSYALVEPLKALQGATGATTVKHLSHGDVEKLVLALPAREEQDAIAAVIQDVDSELVVLKARLDKARAVKVGMMQQLLTGRTRLPVEVVS